MNNIQLRTVLFFALLVFSAGYAQNFQGMAVYESKTALPKFDVPKGMNITPEMQKQIQEGMSKALEKTFVLNFNRTESVYEEEQKLDAPGQNSPFRMMANFGGTSGVLYKNIKDQKLLIQREFFGKDFLINDSLPRLKWVMGGESKKIGNYTCYKATVIVPTNKADFRDMRPKEEKEAEKEKDTLTSAPATNFMDMIEMPKEKTITAWYTPDIPVSQGPENYWGLPGLILEVSDGTTIMLCSKVVLNPKDKAEIKAPHKGKEVTQAEYDDIVVKKVEEMRQMYQMGGGRMPFRSN
ncbi:GLPGLI family protein [Flavobacterium rhizosphaerae]|uniref:GLPGLI family protein n=1 Tax=Flavobacterium rhizosphaerae TaxID=3163298 RepID=A0ABW8YRX9_9FLAO